MTVEELYEQYIKVYEIEVRECGIPYELQLLKEIDMLENITLDQFKERLREPNFESKWGNKPKDHHNFMYNWIRSKSNK
jgi:hypothetical protein